MTIKVGDHLPPGKLSEFVEVETAGCALGPNDFNVEDLTKGKKVVIFGLPGAFTPTCSAKHVPSYLANLDKLKAKGVEFTMEPRTIRPGLRICFLRGPQGISIELLERDQKYV